MLYVCYELLESLTGYSGMDRDLCFLKLRLLKEKLKSWTRDKTLEMKYKSILIEDEINFILNSSSSSLVSLHINDRLRSLRAELKKLRDHELQSARLQSKMIWASLGDSNTKLFHSVASSRKNQNAIWGLEDEEGILVEHDQGLKELGVRHFK